MKSRQALGLIGWASLTFAVAALGALASVDAAAFYAQLARPSWAPPGWLFGPVWSALYALMALSAWLVWRERGFAGARMALALFIAQLAANALWSWLFFGWRQGGLALAEVVLLWCLIVATIAVLSAHQHPRGGPAVSVFGVGHLRLGVDVHRLEA